MTQVRVAALALGAIACGDNFLTEPRIAGQVFSDDNGNGVKDDGEEGIAGIPIVASDGTTELRTTTESDGTYLIIAPELTTYTVRQELPFGFRSGLGGAKPSYSAIIGGSDAAANQYGFMISVGFKFQGFVFPFCGGVLISDRHVVTAAHCSQGEDAQDVGVIAGTLDPFEGGQTFDVESIAIHPDFDGDPGNGFDISLWTLAEPIDLEALNLNTVEMLTPANAQLAAAGKLATTLGWGTSDRDSALLQQVHVPVVAEADCAAVYEGAEAFDTQICAGTAEGGIDSCQGDSGGPLLVRDNGRGVWMHAGITSYGDGCALPGTPGVYGRVSALSAWAKSEALEPAATQMIQFTSLGQIGRLDWPTRSTTRPQVGDIESRWQVTGTSLPGEVEADDPLTVHWSILADDPSLTGFTCTFDPDLSDDTPGEDVECGVGATDFELAGFPTGIFASALTVTRAGDEVMYERRVNVVSGTPPASSKNGALTNNDLLDPDYQDPYFVDYFDVTGLTGKAFAIEAESNQFDVFLTLYNLDQRDFDNGGGILAFGDFIGGNKVRIVVVPEPGVNYLVGVSSFDISETGNYKVSIVNDGTLTVH